MKRTGWLFVDLAFWLAAGAALYFFFLRQESPPARLLGPDSVELARARDGHFHLDGAIQGTPVRFLIDTGASTVSISRDLAARLGVACEHTSAFNTANGVVQGCTGRVSTLDFGPFRLENLTVAVLPQLTSEALLGMNALRHVHLVQKEDRLRLSLSE